MFSGCIRTLRQVKLSQLPCQLPDSGLGAALPLAPAELWAPGWATRVPRWAQEPGGSCFCCLPAAREGHPARTVLCKWLIPLSHHGWALWGLLGISVQKTKVVSIYREASSFGLEHLKKLLILERFLFSILTH